MILGKIYKYVLTVLGLLLPLSAMAEPSGRGMDYIEPTSLHDDVHLLIFGICLLLVAGVCFLLKHKHKAVETTFYIFCFLGGLAAVGGGWSILSKFVLFPIFHVLEYVIYVIIYIVVVLLPYAIIYGIGTHITNIPLRVLFYVVLIALCIWGEYYCIVELEASNLFPEWSFMEAFYENLYPIEE
jgi:hypothetical protein